MKVSTKIKLLKLYEILTIYTDEDHSINTKDLLKKLKEAGIKCDRKTLYDDIDVLNANGYEVIVDRKNFNEYKVVDRRFEVPEVKILIDAIMSAHFISQRKSEALIKKMNILIGIPKHAELLKSYRWENYSKTSNEGLFYSVDRIDRAIMNNKKISFRYFDLDIPGNRVYRKNGERYRVNPLALTLNDNKYYLVAFIEKYKDISIYRVDKMDDVNIDEESRADSDIIDSYKLDEFMRETVGMFVGEKKKVQLLCQNTPEIIVQVRDQFGENTLMFEQEGGFFIAHVEPRVSPAFYSWVFTYMGKIKIISPLEVVKEYKRHLKDSLAEYV